MISLKLAFRSVFRRPSQNFAVVLGIALGVSLFVGVQVGGDSLNAGLMQLTINSLGQRDGGITSVTPFFLTPGVIAEETNPNATQATPVIDGLQSNHTLDGKVKAFTQRLQFSLTVLDPVLGSIEVGKRLTGMDPNQDPAFGTLTNKDGKILKVADLGSHEVYLGQQVAEDVFGTINPIGRNITVQTTLFSQSLPPKENASAPGPNPISLEAISLSINYTISDVFIDKGLGRELYTDYLITPLAELQQDVVNAYNTAKTLAFLNGSYLLGYGNRPINNIYFIYDDGVKLGDQSATVTELIEGALPGIVTRDLAKLFTVSDTRANIIDSVTQATDALELLLNGFGAIIILAGVLVIINIQSMALAARERETGILRAIGAKRGQIVRANLIESLFLGVFGSLLGLLGGALYGRLLVAFLGIAFGFNTGDIPTVITQQTLVSSFFAGFILSQITGLLPAIKASRINIARVMRGIDAPEKEEFNRTILYFGILITAGAIIAISLLNPNPFVDGTDAFKNIDDVTNMYLPFAALIVGPSLLVAHFKNNRLGLSVVGIFLVGWAYVNIFYIMGYIETGTGGLNYILYLIGSLLIGTVLIMAVNLGGLAAAGQRITAWIARSQKTPVRGTTMVAFRKMNSNVTRSTLTFALFATILTLNIWIGTFSYTFRYGVDTQVLALTGGSDAMIYSPDNALPTSLDFSQKLLDQFDQASGQTYITDAKPFTVLSGGIFYLNSTDPLTKSSFKGVSVAKDSFWKDGSQSDWIFPFNLQDNKTGTPFENHKDQKNDPPATSEDQAVWKALANNETIKNKDGELRPILVTSLIFSFSGTSFQILKQQGDSVYLNTTDGKLQEFVIASLSQGNPLQDLSGGMQNGPPGLTSTFFVSDVWKDKLQVFGGYAKSENTYLVKTNADDPSSKSIPTMLTKVEQWANSGDFENQYGLYGLIGISTYSIYQSQLEGQYRFFQFLQAFVSLGFAVGILGLLVVASRSVAERKREIGMLRALGFRRRDVVVSVVLELIVMGMIGLFIGFVNGTVMGYALTSVQGDTQFLIPWGLIAIYGLATLFSAILAAIFPAIRASQIPPSDALRYTG